MVSLQSDNFSILVVDDDPSVCLTLGDILELHGYAVQTAGTGTDALELVERSRHPPGLALLDLQLPDMDGFHLSDRLRAKVPELRVIILTGHATIDSAVSAVRCGTVDYLIKPVDPPDLVKAVEQGRGRWRSAVVETALLGSLERFRSVIENLSELVTVVGPSGDIVYESPVVKRLFGFEVNERLGHRFDQYVHADDRKTFQRCLSEAVNGADSARCTVRSLDAAGDWKSIEVSAMHVAKESSIEGLILTSRDVTRRMRLEAQLRQAQKMEAIGQVTGGIAHELNNLLTVVTANVEAVLAGLSAGQGIHRDLTDAHEAARHGARLIQKLLGFSRRERLCPKPVDMVEVTRRTVHMIQRTLSEKVVLRCAHERSTSSIALADADALEQIIMNLVNNAADAMPEGGEIDILIETVDLDSNFVSQHNGAMCGKYVRLTVQDNGVGMEPSVVDRIFEPFFSTKPISEGTGLGMAMVYGLTKQQNGYIQVASIPSEGTTVSVYLPATAEKPVEPVEEEKAPVVPANSNITILVVEDQPKLREASRRVLERLGYHVITAVDGVDGMRVVNETAEQIDLVVADVVMPRMGGLEFHEALVKKGLHFPTLFTSGFSAQDVRVGKQLDPQFRLLQKPWTVDEFACAVNTTLQANQQHALTTS